MDPTVLVGLIVVVTSGHANQCMIQLLKIYTPHDWILSKKKYIKYKIERDLIKIESSIYTATLIVSNKSLYNFLSIYEAYRSGKILEPLIMIFHIIKI